MKIFCPECSTSYDLPIAMLANGRRMRCANCGHIWMQEPVQETPYAAVAPRQDMDIDPIPMSVHPQDLPEEEQGHGGPGFFDNISWGGLGRMIAGFLLGWVLVYGLLYGMLAMGALPGFFKPLALAMGMNAGSDMAGLEVQNVTATTTGKTTTVTGKLFNSAAQARTVPVIELTPVTADGVTGEGKEIKPTQSHVEPGKTVEFKAEMNTTLDAGAGVRVRLLAD